MTIDRKSLESALSGDLAALKSVPKTDLHAHLLLSAPFKTLHTISDGRIPHPPERFADLEDFLQHLRLHYFPEFNSVDVYRRIIRDSFDHMISDGIHYTQASFDISMPLLLGMKWKDLIDFLRPEVERVAARLDVEPELGLARDFPLPNWREIVAEALDTDFFRGIDLYGAETLRPVTDFADFFSEARRRDLRIKIHCGETGDARRLIDEVTFVQPHAVQHGVRAAEDAAAMKLLADSGIPVNVCPHSNWCLRVVSEYRKHPIRKMLDAGIKVTLNSDDLTVFGRSVSEEYAELYRAGIFNPEELEQIRQNGLGARGKRYE